MKKDDKIKSDSDNNSRIKINGINTSINTIGNIVVVVII